jgi:hypothetical protein
MHTPHIYIFTHTHSSDIILFMFCVSGFCIKSQVWWRGFWIPDTLDVRWFKKLNRLESLTKVVQWKNIWGTCSNFLQNYHKHYPVEKMYDECIGAVLNIWNDLEMLSLLLLIYCIERWFMFNVCFLLVDIPGAWWSLIVYYWLVCGRPYNGEELDSDQQKQQGEMMRAVWWCYLFCNVNDS